MTTAERISSVAAVFAFTAHCCIAASALAQPARLSAGGEAVVSTVVDGDTVRLADGRQVRLVGIQAPKLPLGRKGFKKWPLADESKLALEELTLGRKIRLFYDGRRLDRYGRALAHIFAGDANEVWIQQSMLRRGMARVYSFPDNRAQVKQMLAAEKTARRYKRGIWGLRWYRVLTPAQAADWIGTFQLVAGRVVSTAIVRGRLYINFGRNWRDDFTISVSRRDYKRFKAAGFRHDQLAGRRVEVRGWLKSYNGPLIEATHPEQVEVIGAAPMPDGERQSQ